MFLMLGLLALPSAIVEVTWVGLGLGLVLAFLARPLVVALCLLMFFAYIYVRATNVVRDA